MMTATTEISANINADKNEENINNASPLKRRKQNLVQTDRNQFFTDLIKFHEHRG